MSESFEDVIADETAQAKILRTNGFTREAELKERLLARVVASLGDYGTWLSESKALLRSGRKDEWLRSKFREWEPMGFARTRNGKREFRRFIVPARHPEEQSAGSADASSDVAHAS